MKIHTDTVTLALASVLVDTVKVDAIDLWAFADPWRGIRLMRRRSFRLASTEPPVEGCESPSASADFHGPWLNVVGLQSTMARFASARHPPPGGGAGGTVTTGEPPWPGTSQSDLGSYCSFFCNGPVWTAILQSFFGLFAGYLG